MAISGTAYQAQRTHDAQLAEYLKNIATQNALVRRHEFAHQSVSGPQANGSPVFLTTTDADGRTVITGGYQMIKVSPPASATMPLSQIEGIRTAAQYTREGAKAPQSFDKLSGADESVAARGDAVFASAEIAEHQRRELDARLALNGQKPDGILTAKQIASVGQSKISGGNSYKPEIGKQVNFFA